MRWTKRRDYYFALVCLITATTACSAITACTLDPIFITIAMVLIVLTGLYVVLGPEIIKEMEKK